MIRGVKNNKKKAPSRSNKNNTIFLIFIYDEVSRNAHNGETNAKKLITRPIMTVTSPNSPHIALTYTKMRFDNFFDHSYPPSWSKLPKCIESGVVFLSGQKSNPKVRVYRGNFNTKNFPKTFFQRSLYMLGLCHSIFTTFLHENFFTVTVTITTTLVRSIFQKLTKLRKNVYKK